jgi:hypothetical protein
MSFYIFLGGGQSIEEFCHIFFTMEKKISRWKGPLFIWWTQESEDTMPYAVAAILIQRGTNLNMKARTLWVRGN